MGNSPLRLAGGACELFLALIAAHSSLNQDLSTRSPSCTEVTPRRTRMAPAPPSQQSYPRERSERIKEIKAGPPPPHARACVLFSGSTDGCHPQEEPDTGLSL